MATGIIKIGEHDVKMSANAMTPVLFQRLYHKDFMIESQSKQLDLNLFQELGFVMAMQGTDKTVKELQELSIDNYYEWLMQFEALDIMKAVNEIFALYSGQTTTSSTPKKKGR